MNRAFTNILCDNVDEVAQFYEELLGLSRRGDFGWFIILGHDDMPDFELGILNRQHDTVPEDIMVAPKGVILTFVVDDIAPIYSKACSMNANIIQQPTDMVYGQRRLMLCDPAGTFVDVSAPIQ